jgi:MFS family permease
LSKSFSIDAATVLTATFGVATFVFHIANAGKYGYQRDELYFISCARHLAWGYVDQPPLIAVVAKIVLAILGDSLYAIRLVPAVAAALTVALTGRLARRLGGGLFAMGLAMLGIALAPFYLAVGSLLTMNAFEPMLWLGTAYLFLRADDEDRLPLWLGLGIVAGLGLVNKYSMFFFLGSCIIGIALTPARRSLRRPGFSIAAAIALAIVAPTLAWQGQHEWPQLQVLRDAAARKNVVTGPLVFYGQQLLMMDPLSAPLWLAGLAGMLFRASAVRLRWYGITYVALSLIYVALDAKVYYLAPIYPVLFAAGAPLITVWFSRLQGVTIAYGALLFAGGLVIAPEAFPLLPLDTFLRYQRIFDVRGVKMERHPEGKVPQHFADQLGWNTLVATLARAYDKLPPAQRRQAVILTHDYGQASAVDFFGPRYGLPPAISGHNNYYLWGTHGASGNVVLSVGVPRAKLRMEFGKIRQVGLYHDPYVLPDFNNLPVYLGTQPIEPLAVWWPAVKRYI